jgi:transcriptional regulator with GAF, ATPase, and Fis domain
LSAIFDIVNFIPSELEFLYKYLNLPSQAVSAVHKKTFKLKIKAKLKVKLVSNTHVHFQRSHATIEFIIARKKKSSTTAFDKSITYTETH